jgi:hypothetical protein
MARRPARSPIARAVIAIEDRATGATIVVYAPSEGRTLMQSPRPAVASRLRRFADRLEPRPWRSPAPLVRLDGRWWQRNEAGALTMIEEDAGAGQLRGAGSPPA